MYEKCRSAIVLFEQRAGLCIALRGGYFWFVCELFPSLFFNPHSSSSPIALSVSSHALCACVCEWAYALGMMHFVFGMRLLSFSHTSGRSADPTVANPSPSRAGQLAAVYALEGIVCLAWCDRLLFWDAFMPPLHAPPSLLHPPWVQTERPNRRSAEQRNQRERKAKHKIGRLSTNGQSGEQQGDENSAKRARNIYVCTCEDRGRARLFF